MTSCKSNFVGKRFDYSKVQNDGFELIFVNDSILEVSSNTETNNSNKAIYKYNILEKETLERIRENQPAVNFKTKKLYGQFYQNIAIELVYSQNKYFKETDTLNYLKMRADGIIKKLIFFDNGNKLLEFKK